MVSGGSPRGGRRGGGESAHISTGTEMTVLEVAAVAATQSTGIPRRCGLAVDTRFAD